MHQAMAPCSHLFHYQTPSVWTADAMFSTGVGLESVCSSAPVADQPVLQRFDVAGDTQLTKKFAESSSHLQLSGPATKLLTDVQVCGGLCSAKALAISA